MSDNLPFSTVGYLTASKSFKSEGEADFNGQPIKNVANPTDAQDVATKAYVDTSIAGGGSPITIGEVLTNGDDAYQNTISNLSDPQYDQDATTKNYVDQNIQLNRGNVSSDDSSPSLFTITPPALKDASYFVKTDLTDNQAKTVQLTFPSMPAEQNPKVYYVNVAIVFEGDLTFLRDVGIVDSSPTNNNILFINHNNGSGDLQSGVKSGRIAIDSFNGNNCLLRCTRVGNGSVEGVNWMVEYFSS